MFGNRSRQPRSARPSDPLTGPGLWVVFLGAVMFFGPTYFHQSWLLTSWLGSMQAPVGLSLMVVGGILAVTGFVRGRVTKAPDLPAATLDPSIAPPPPGPEETRIGGSSAPASSAPAPGPGIASTPAPAIAPAATPAPSLGAGIDAPPPPLEPIYRPPTSLDDLGPSGPA